MEQKTLGIPFQTLPRKRKQLGIPFRGTKIEENSWKSLTNPSAEEKQLGIPFRGTIIEANSWNSLPFQSPSAEEKTTRHSLLWSKNISKFSEFLSKQFRGRENDSEQNAAAAVSDSYPIESSCLGRKNWFPPPWLKVILFSI